MAKIVIEVEVKEVPKDIEIEYYKLFVKAKPKKLKEKTEDVTNPGKE